MSHKVDIEYENGMRDMDSFDDIDKFQVHESGHTVMLTRMERKGVKGRRWILSTNNIRIIVIKDNDRDDYSSF